MPIVIIEGQYLGASIKTSNFNGVEKSSVQVDVYQADSSENDKNVTVKCEDLTMMNKFAEMKMGSPFKAKCSISAYQNKTYFKLLSLA